MRTATITATTIAEYFSAVGRLGGAARAKSLTAKRRREISRLGGLSAQKRLTRRERSRRAKLQHSRRKQRLATVLADEIPIANVVQGELPGKPAKRKRKA